MREVVGARVGRLGPEGTRVLSTAAVIGRDFDLELLARATEVDEDDVLDLLEAAEGSLPFCSARCRDVDLNRWLSGTYVIPARDDEPDDVD